MRTDALIDLAEVLSAAGNTDRARAALEQARDLAVLKEMAVPLKRVDILLDGLGRKPAQPVV
jgi:hypothetical protein